MPSKNELYKCELRLRGEYARVDRAATSERNKIVLRGFMQHCLARNLTAVRTVKLAYHARLLAEMLGKDFEAATREDIHDLVVRINGRADLTGWTKADYRVALRQVYKYLLPGDDVPALVRWVRSLPRQSELGTLREDDLLTEEEFERVLAAARTPLERAFVSVLRETGARIGELLTLNEDGVTFEGDVAYLHVNGKTGPRDIPIVWSVAALLEYLDGTRAGPDKPLWKGSAKTRRPFLGYWTVCKMLRRLCREAGITKRVNPHRWRHARATLDAKRGLERFHMCSYFGWRFSSKMPDTYIHITARSITPVIRTLRGQPGPTGRPPLPLPPERRAVDGPSDLLRGLRAIAHPTPVPIEAAPVEASEGELLRTMLANPAIRAELLRALTRP